MEQIHRCEWAGPDQIYIDYHVPPLIVLILRRLRFMMMQRSRSLWQMRESYETGEK